MRRVIAITTTVMLCALLVSMGSLRAQPGQNSAPADEYFGRQKMSVLEIRNRLHAFEQKTDDEIAADPNRNVGIDAIEDATVDWMQQYPSDPWLPDALDRLVHCYERAGSTATNTAAVVVGALLTRFPQSAQAKDAAESLLGRTAPAASLVTVSGHVVDTAGNPIAGALVLGAAGQESADPRTAVFAMTASDGGFSLANLAPGQIFLRVEPPHGSTFEVGHAIVSASETASDAGRIVLAPQAAATAAPSTP